MQKLATKNYSPIAVNDFIVCSDNMLLLDAKFPLIIHDKDNRSLRNKNIKFHIRSGDYFGTLATVIDLVRQERKKIEGRQNKILKKLKDDLVYLQKNHKIVEKK